MNQIAYTIESSTKDYTVLTFSSGESYSLARWRQLESNSDVLALMTKEESAYQKKLTGRTPQVESLLFKQLHISTAQVIPLFKLIASRLYFGTKQLVCDFYGQVQFYYQAIPLAHNKIEVQGFLRWSSKDIPLSDCLLVGAGDPLWFIHGLSLKLLTTDLLFKDLQAAQQPKVLEGGLKTEFLENCADENIEIVIKGGSHAEIEQQNDPLPLLVLKDRLGAFADLKMDYGPGLLVDMENPGDRVANSKCKRQRQVEKSWEKDLFETDFIKKVASNSHYYCPVDKIAKSLTFLLEIGWKILDWKGNEVVRQEDYQLTMDEQTNAIVIHGKIRYADHEVDLSSVVGAFNRRDSFVQLGVGKVGLLPPKESGSPLYDLAQEVELCGETLKVAKSKLGALSPWFHQARLSPSLQELKEKWSNFAGIEENPPSSTFKGELRPYQQIGLNWLSFLHDYSFHGILADEMGLGKTVQILALLSTIDTLLPHLIVLPTSLLFNWKNEIHKFLPEVRCYVHQGPNRLHSVQELSRQTIILTSYTTLRIDGLLFQKIPFHAVILDEAQMIKNAHTQTAQAVFSLNAQLRLCITGTPVENHLNELWSHFHFLMPDLFGTLESFEAEVLAAQSDKRYLERIKRKIAPFILRRRKQEVAKDLPERIDQIMWIEMQPEQRQMYDQFLSGVRGGLLKKVEVDGISKHRLEILEAILRLRQICCHPLLVSSLLDEQMPLSNAKFEALCEDLETIVEEGGKALVYSQFTSMLKLMAKYATDKGWKFAYLDGSTSNREKVVTTFQEDPHQSLFFISLKAGGVGLNLTAADYVYLYDPWWNDAVEEQAINRAHRIGRQEVVIAKRFITLESIEEKMMKLKAAKSLIVEEVLTSETAPTNLTVDDLAFLLS